MGKKAHKVKRKQPERAEPDAIERFPNGENGRGPNGQFIKGCKGGPGNPNNQKVMELRATLMNAVGTDDLAAVVKALIRKAKRGHVPAAKELMDRVLGRAIQAVELTGANGGPVQASQLNLSILSVKDLETMREILVKAQGEG